MKLLIMLILFLPFVSYAEGKIEYIPKGKLFEFGNYKDYEIQRYSTLLTRMKEPSLWEISKSKNQKESYRFIVPTDIDGDFICIRVEINNSDEVSIYKKMFNVDRTKVGYEGELIINEKKDILKKELQLLLKTINEINFWKLRSEDFLSFNKNGFITFDSPIWFFEGVKNNEYQAVEIPMDKYSSDLIPKIYQFGDSFLVLAGLYREEDKVKGISKDEKK